MKYQVEVYRVTIRIIILIFLTNFSVTYGCTPVPPKQERKLSVTVGNFTLPVSMAFAGTSAVLEKVTTMSSSAEAAKLYVQKLVAEAIDDVLKDLVESGLLPNVSIDAIMEQITIQTNYDPLRCAKVAVNPLPHTELESDPVLREACFIIDNVVTGICPLTATITMQKCQLSPIEGSVAPSPVPKQHLIIHGTLTINHPVLVGWTTEQWQTVLNAVPLFLISHGGSSFIRSTITVH